MTEQPFPPKVSLDTGRRGGSHRPDPTPAPEPTLAPQLEQPATVELPASIDLQYYLDDPSEAFLVVTFDDGTVVESPLSEMKLARLRAQLDGQADALARARWELGGGAPDDFVPEPVAVPLPSESDSPETVDSAMPDAEDDDGFLAAVDRRTRNWRDPLHAGPVIDDLQKKEYKGRNVGSILLVVVGALMALGLLVNVLIVNGVL
ncbi:hypothetical protein [Gordonia sihwensis]|uniref:hypothetical protein n=1 Tax=Gordonia sihwensis TaxID=173559 RepID=UPI0005F025C8|nr:hypothetical protein [Gordonia sihwensis]KJR10431.1 hypothetical protein UG54_00030 [Gordonia sihwensis]